MWNQACSQSTGGASSQDAVTSKKATLQILPCTVSQLLSASQVSSDTFAICDWEFNQVSVMGVIRGFSPFKTNVQYTVDDMTAPPIKVKQWINRQDCALSFASPGTYVKVVGSLRNCSDKRLLLAMNIRCIRDLNEITSHMLEVVQAHMQLFGKMFDVNMNTTVASLSGSCTAGCLQGILPNGLSTIQAQVLNVIRKFSVKDEGISFHDLRMQLDYLCMSDIRSSLGFLLNEGHVFSTIDEHHFKSAEY